MASLEKLLEKSISFRTVSGDFAESERLLDWVEKYIDNRLKIKRFKTNGFPSLIATVRATKMPKLLLASHIDVVPASDEMFKLRVRGDKLIGRGTADMKFGLTCYLQLLDDLGNDVQKHNFGLMLTADEEIGGRNGVEMLVKKGYSAKTLFLPDGGHDWKMQDAAKGVLHLKVTSTGKTAHGSRPWEGFDPVQPLLLFIQELRKEFPMEPCKDATHYHDSMNVGKLNAGRAANQVPSEAEAFIDIRHVPETTKASLTAKVRRVASRYPTIHAKEILSGNAYRAQLDRPEIREWSRLVKEETGITTGTMFTHGSSDARFFDMKKTTALITRPESGNVHSEEEWISRKGLAQYYSVFRRWVQNVA